MEDQDVDSDALHSLKKYEESRKAAVHSLIEDEVRAVISSILYERRCVQEIEKNEVDVRTSLHKESDVDEPPTRMKFDVDVINDDPNDDYLKVTEADVREMTEAALREKVRSFFGIDDLRVWSRPAVEREEEKKEVEVGETDVKEMDESRDKEKEELGHDPTISPSPPIPPPPKTRSIFPSSAVLTPLQTPLSSPAPSLRVTTAAVQTSLVEDIVEPNEDDTIDTPIPTDVDEEYEQDSFQVGFVNLALW